MNEVGRWWYNRSEITEIKSITACVRVVGRWKLQTRDPEVSLRVNYRLPFVTCYHVSEIFVENICNLNIGGNMALRNRHILRTRLLMTQIAFFSPWEKTNTKKKIKVEENETSCDDAKGKKNNDNLEIKRVPVRYQSQQSRWNLINRLARYRFCED